MTDAVKLSGLRIVDLPRRAFRTDGACPDSTARHTRPTRESKDRAGTGAEAQGVRPNELDRLHRSLAEVTPENHPRTARLLASSTRKIAQKVIEEAGEAALAAVKHNARGIVRESADLLYHLVALWHRAGIDPDDVWTEMRCRADTLGIAEKRPKTRGDHRNPSEAKAEQQSIPNRNGS
jgi:phosphoribosyl-ATP pyrophosphohydrolase